MMDWLQQFSEFHFLRPHWLWALLPLLAIGLTLSHWHKQQSGWQSVLAGHLYRHLICHESGKKNRPPLWLLNMAWLIATLALAGPTWQRLPQPVYQLHSGKVVLMDMSMSMRATDLNPNRLTRAKYKAIDLVKQLSEGETGLVAYAGDAFTISPLSSDGQNLTTLIPSLSPEIMPIPGSDPALGLQAAINLLQSASYQQGEIFWITDGVDNQQLQELQGILGSSPYRLSILAVGTEEGAPIKMLDGELLKDRNGAIVIPKVPMGQLKTLARQGGGRFAPMQADNSDIEYLVNQSQLSQDENADEEQANQDNFGDKWQEMGPYLLLLLLPFAAYSFRRGLITVVLLGTLLPIATPQAQAGWWQDMWHNSDQQGLAAFQQQQFDEAAQTFKDPLWQGSAAYKSQDYESAVKAFSKVEGSEARYNQGNALAQLQQYAEAIKQYEQVLASDPAHADAKANKALLEKLLEQQQEQQKQQESDQQQSDQQQENQDQESDQQDQGQSEQQDEQEQQQNAQDSQNQESEQQEQQQDQQQKDNAAEQEQQNTEQQEQQQAEQEAKEKDQEQEQQAQQLEQQELSDEEKEQMQRMQHLLNRVPDDPAFLLKRKMQIEAQQRKRERSPSNLQRNW
jgi:Ca-activated chloride channel homolog